MESTIERNRRFYGGLNPGVYDVLFTQGEMDPMRTIGINEDLNPRSPAIVMSREWILCHEKLLQCFPFFSQVQSSNKDLGSPSDTDLPVLLNTKARARSLIFQWIGRSEPEEL